MVTQEPWNELVFMLYALQIQATPGSSDFLSRYAVVNSICRMAYCQTDRFRKKIKGKQKDEQQPERW